ncbi:MAG: FecCD family ABC transporter permease [Eubacteriaceae bacterium]
MSNINKKEITEKVDAYRQYTKKKWIITFILLVLVFLLSLITVNAGAAEINPLEVLKTILGYGSEKSAIVIWRIRMPRVITAIIAGAGLSIAGCVMQNNLRNPLASPQTIGISHAAAFGANVAIIVFGAGSIQSTGGNAVIINNPYIVTICAFTFSMLATLIILSLAKLRGFSPESIVLAGVALGSLFTAGITIIQYFAHDIEIATAVFWTFGDLGKTSWDEVLIMTVVFIVSLIYFIFRRWDYNALDNGDEVAKSLGVNTEKVRFQGMLISSLITAVAVSFLGMIGFIGLIGPQIMRRIIGSDHRFLIPASALAGSVLLLSADTLARVIISPVVLPVGAITSMLGAPLFIYLLMKGGVRR